MKFALNIPLVKITTDGAGSAGKQVRTLVRGLEDAGLDACLTSEHPAPSAQWLRNDPGGHDCTDPLTAFAYVAACSERLQLFTNILVLPYRNPFLLAKAAATLQILSDNRLLLGVGVGYQKEEFDALGADFTRRGKIADEAIETMRLVWAGGEVARQRPDVRRTGQRGAAAALPAPADLGRRRQRRGARPRGAARRRLGALFPRADQRSPGAPLGGGRHGALRREGRAACGNARGTRPHRPVRHGRRTAFRPKEPSRENADKFLGEVEQLAAHGVNWIWTSIPSDDTARYLEMVAWFGEEVVGVWRKA